MTVDTDFTIAPPMSVASDVDGGMYWTADKCATVSEVKKNTNPIFTCIDVLISATLSSCAVTAMIDMPMRNRMYGVGSSPSSSPVIAHVPAIDPQT